MSKKKVYRDSKTTLDDDESPYEFTKTGLTGEQRSSMLESELQLLSELGKPHRRGHKLPPINFTYGLKLPHRDGGVAAVMYHASEEKRVTQPDFIFIRDYFALNRAALEAGMLTARDQSRFRTMHDIQKKVFLRDTSHTKRPPTFSNDTVFGMPYKPSVPMVELLQHHFGDKWVETMHNKQMNHKKQQSETVNVLKRRYHTKTSLLRQAQIPVSFSKSLKLTHTKQQVDSFRSAGERRRAIN